MRSELILLAVSFLAFQKVLSQTPVPRNGIGTCPILSSDSDIFGNRTHLSDQGLVPVLFIGGDGTEPLTLKILRVHKLCEAIGLYRNTSSSVGFLVEFERTDGNTETVQVLLDCLPDPRNSNANYSFFPLPNPGDSQLGARNTPRAEMRTLLTAGDGFVIPNNFTIAAEFECGLCGSFGGIFADTTTRCISCNTACNKGMNKCLGQGSDQCCSYFLNNACVGSCPSPLVPNSETFDCGCVPLTINNGTVTYSNEQLIGSVATYSCDGDHGYKLPLGASATRTCKIDEGWTGNDASCVLHDCKMTGLFDPLNGDVTLQSGTTTFGSIATYKCDNDYQLSGVSQRMCTLDGWSGDSPSCDIKPKGCSIECNSGTCDENTNTCMCPPEKTGPNCLDNIPTPEPSTGSACGTSCIIGIVVALVGAIILAAVVAAVAFGIYSYLNNPETKMAKFEHDKFAGCLPIHSIVARDNPLYVDPEAVVGDGAEAA